MMELNEQNAIQMKKKSNLNKEIQIKIGYSLNCHIIDGNVIQNDKQNHKFNRYLPMIANLFDGCSTLRANGEHFSYERRSI